MEKEHITFTPEEITLIYANAGLTHKSSKAKKRAALSEARKQERSKEN